VLASHLLQWLKVDRFCKNISTCFEFLSFNSWPEHIVLNPLPTEILKSHISSISNQTYTYIPIHLHLFYDFSFYLFVPKFNYNDREDPEYLQRWKVFLFDSGLNQEYIWKSAIKFLYVFSGIHFKDFGYCFLIPPTRPKLVH